MSFITIAIALTLIVVALFVTLGVRALRVPELAARGFGLSLERAGGAYVRVYAARNLAITVAVVALLALGDFKGLAVLLTCAMALPVFDAVLLRRHGAPWAVLLRHAVGFVFVATCAFSWWVVS